MADPDGICPECGTPKSGENGLSSCLCDKQPKNDARCNDGSEESLTIHFDDGNKLELTNEILDAMADEHAGLDDEINEIDKKSRVPASELFTSQDDGVSSDPNG